MISVRKTWNIFRNRNGKWSLSSFFFSKSCPLQEFVLILTGFNYSTWKHWHCVFEYNTLNNLLICQVLLFVSRDPTDPANCHLRSHIKGRITWRHYGKEGTYNYRRGHSKGSFSSIVLFLNEQPVFLVSVWTCLAVSRKFSQADAMRVETFGQSR